MIVIRMAISDENKIKTCNWKLNISIFRKNTYDLR